MIADANDVTKETNSAPPSSSSHGKSESQTFNSSNDVNVDHFSQFSFSEGNQKHYDQYYDYYLKYYQEKLGVPESESGATNTGTSGSSETQPMIAHPEPKHAQPPPLTAPFSKSSSSSLALVAYSGSENEDD